MPNVAAILGAGAKFGFETDGQGTYQYVEGLEMYPATNNAAEPKEKTTVTDTRRVYGIGLKDSPDIEISGILLSEDTAQQAFLTAARAGTEMNCVIDIPQLGASGKRRSFKLLPLGVNDNEVTADEWIKFTIPCKQNTNVVETDIPAP